MLKFGFQVNKKLIIMSWNKINLNLILVLLILLSCKGVQNDEKENLKLIFENLKKNTAESILNNYKMSKVDSCETIKMMSQKIDSVYQEIINKKKLYHFLDSILLTNSPLIKKMYLNVAFHTYLNGQDFTSQIAMEKLKEALNCDWVKIDKANTIENSRITKENFQSNNVGDTLSLIFPVEDNYGRKSTFFYSGYPYSNDYSTADDSLCLKVLLTSKSYLKLPDLNFDSTYFIFKVRIIELSDTNIEINSERYSIGDEFDFHLNFYGRGIN